MIEDFKAKMDGKRVSLEFAETEGNVLLLERRFDEVTGREYLKPTQETNVSHLDDLLAAAETRIVDAENELASRVRHRDDLVAIREAVASKLDEGGEPTKNAEKGAK